MSKVGDLSPKDFPTELSWDYEEESKKSLDKLYDYAVGEVERYIQWYYEKRKVKRRLGLWLRVFAIVITAIAGVIPIVNGIAENPLFIPPALATLALAIAALLVLIDKFGGGTSGWVRYITTAQELSQLLEDFRFEWENIKITMIDKASPTIEQVTAAISQCKAFMIKSHEVIRQETRLWVTEFQNVLKDLEKTAKAVAKLEEAGAISVEVSNGDQCDSGWKIKIDGGQERTYQGKQASIDNLSPKIHTVSVSGIINQKQKQAEKPVDVLSGKITNVTLTLE